MGPCYELSFRPIAANDVLPHPYLSHLLLPVPERFTNKKLKNNRKGSNKENSDASLLSHE